jgi:hypothetical protein
MISSSVAVPDDTGGVILFSLRITVPTEKTYVKLNKLKIVSDPVPAAHVPPGVIVPQIVNC